MSEVRQRLLNARKNGTFLDVVHQIYMQERSSETSIGTEIAALHNEGAIDVIAEFHRLPQNLQATSFFTARRIFADALPELNAPVDAVMHCVKHLVAESGNDMVAGGLFTPFTSYCEAEPDRPREALKIIESAGDAWADFVAPAIIAGANLHFAKYLTIAINLTRHTNVVIRAQAVFVLGKIDYRADQSLLAKAVAALQEVVRLESDDRLLGAAIRSAFVFYTIDNGMESQVVELIKAALARKEAQAIHAASELFGTADKIPDTLLDVLWEAIQTVIPQNKDSLHYIDFGLLRLVHVNQDEKVFSFLEHLLLQNPFELSIEAFSNLAHYINRNEQLLLNKLATRWLLSRKIPLCEAILDIIRLNPGNYPRLVVDKDQLARHAEGACLFVGRKALGWLFTCPESCASFIVSALEIAAEDEFQELLQLLFNPLLISYSGSVKQYLDTVLPQTSTKVKEALTAALSGLESYHEGLKSAWDLPELLPSQAQREAYSRLFNRQMSDSLKEAQKHSILNLIASKEVLLYGRKSISYIHGPDDQTNRMEIPLQSIGHSIEFPSLERVDPHGLDYALRVLRVEGCSQ